MLKRLQDFGDFGESWLSWLRAFWAPWTQGLDLPSNPLSFFDVTKDVKKTWMLTWEVCEAIALIFGSALGLLCSYIIFAVQKIINRGSWTKMTSSTWSPDTIAALALSSWVAKLSLCFVSWKMFKYGLCVFNKALWSPRSDVETTIFKVSSGSEIGLLGQQLGHKGLKLQRKIRDSETDEKNDWK